MTLGKALHLPTSHLGGGKWVETTDPPCSCSVILSTHDCELLSLRSVEVVPLLHTAIMPVFQLWANTQKNKPPLYTTEVPK